MPYPQQSIFNYHCVFCYDLGKKKQLNIYLILDIVYHGLMMTHKKYVKSKNCTRRYSQNCIIKYVQKKWAFLLLDICWSYCKF